MPDAAGDALGDQRRHPLGVGHLLAGPVDQLRQALERAAAALGHLLAGVEGVGDVEARPALVGGEEAQAGAEGGAEALAPGAGPLLEGGGDAAAQLRVDLLPDGEEALGEAGEVVGEGGLVEAGALPHGLGGRLGIAALGDEGEQGVGDAAGLGRAGADDAQRGRHLGPASGERWGAARRALRPRRSRRRARGPGRARERTRAWSAAGPGSPAGRRAGVAGAASRRCRRRSIPR